MQWFGMLYLGLTTATFIAGDMLSGALYFLVFGWALGVGGRRTAFRRRQGRREKSRVFPRLHDSEYSELEGGKFSPIYI